MSGEGVGAGAASLAIPPRGQEGIAAPDFVRPTPPDLARPRSTSTGDELGSAGGPGLNQSLLEGGIQLAH
jgi:hypothetical protein